MSRHHDPDLLDAVESVADMAARVRANGAEAHYATDSPIIQPATDEEVAAVPRALLRLPDLPAAKQLRVRKFLRYCLDALNEPSA